MRYFKIYRDTVMLFCRVEGLAATAYSLHIHTHSGFMSSRVTSIQCIAHYSITQQVQGNAIKYIATKQHIIKSQAYIHTPTAPSSNLGNLV